MDETERVHAVASAVMDPELPVVTIGELGIVREATISDGRAIVTITPTYSGCPAMDVIRADIVSALRREGFGDVEIRTVYAPAWTTDWVSDSGRRKLAAGGIAPPGAAAVGRRPVLPLLPPPAPVCPRCESVAVAEISRFGPTACTSLWRCLDCAEPFEHMKAH
ncbi:1,2-phenylacetyl-CoA epoxidase subunit PaaD [Stackebrandtia soli]|uniref:1,2-phenylacetyl-CoA epoxidase subunit PaaD n=1 Tax=Stackebrandtia soli TaxID=1892856 RepID=UPI0039E8501A